MVSSHLLVCPGSPKSVVTAALVLLGVRMDVGAVTACSSEVWLLEGEFPLENIEFL